jgi:hypothetical protein
MSKEPWVSDWVPSFVMSVIVLIVVVTVLGMRVESPRDNSDPLGGRSNMNVLTDALTGCQYLETRKGGITPRMDANNKQVCN